MVDPTKKENENVELEVDILKSNANLHLQKLGENEIGIVGIENSQQNEFVVDINLRHIDQCDHLDEKIDLIYILFDDHKMELLKNSENGQFHVDKTISIKFKSSLSDLIIYFRNIFSLPIILTSHNDVNGMFSFWQWLLEVFLYVYFD